MEEPAGLVRFPVSKDNAFCLLKVAQQNFYSTNVCVNDTARASISVLHKAGDQPTNLHILPYNVENVAMWSQLPKEIFFFF